MQFSRLFLTHQQHQDCERFLEFMRVAQAYARDRRMGPLKDMARLWHDMSEKPMRELEVSNQDSDVLRITKNMARFKIIHSIDVAWVDVFFVTLLTDTKKYQTPDDTLRYVYGIAEAPALIGAAIVGVPKAAAPAVQAQARAFQWLHFMYDISKNAAANVCYFSKDDLKSCALPSVQKDTVSQHPREFEALINTQLGRFYEWQNEANGLSKYLSRRQRTALQGAIDAYTATARTIMKDPSQLYSSHIAPSRMRFVLATLGHSFD